ncbi:MerR family transcriptional regulator [Pelagerythrobacter rhizovicinus]|uniref:MerR family transcriptional regulator n=1 Tax=Pelagerythrobacter rhizovicinus TaxID=2268576 RepID=A0A4V1QWC6_9SPHN|nr:MerR family transcriptional regulator [Pelagerythrobacter rhizovicinus]RXZ65686.1 MerR family transcriptional regulator [Pelagerythrobacter rhizovicinus]
MVTEFDDGKERGALRTIGEVSQALGIKPHVLRYWEQQFPMLQPLKRSGGRRYYRAGDIALVERIDRLVNREGYTLKGALAALKGTEASPKPESPPQNARTSDLPADVLPRLKAIREKLASALSV